MEPSLVTPPELQPILAELSALETIFHWPPPRMTRAALEAMTVDGFWEVGASGRRYSREFVMGELERRRDAPEPDVWEITDFQCSKLAADVYLLTYTLLQFGTRLTRRSSIWQKAAEGWKCVYHQGTVVENT